MDRTTVDTGLSSRPVERPDGWIATNAHVAHRPVSVVLDDGRRFGARVVRRSPDWDLAAIKIDADGLPSARIGDSDVLAVGELLLAAGYPFGLSSAVTAGIVHAIGRPEASTPLRWIQADLRLAPGNSGGPVANARETEVLTMMAEGLGNKRIAARLGIS
ncbi:MAG: serine protease, partial [Candidatus Rokuibacteriota bacterium]